MPPPAPTINCETPALEKLSANPQRPANLFDIPSLQAYSADLNDTLITHDGVTERNGIKYNNLVRCLRNYAKRGVIQLP